AARTRAYHAADVVPVARDELAAIDPAQLGALRVMLHPSLQVLRSRYPVVTIWAMNSGEMPLGPVDETQAEDALILRPAYEVGVRRLPQGGAAFLLALSEGATLSAAAEAALAEAAEFNL